MTNLRNKQTVLMLFENQPNNIIPSCSGAYSYEGLSTLNKPFEAQLLLPKPISANAEYINILPQH